MKKRVFMITAICFLLTGLFLCGCSQQQQSEQQQPAETQQPEQVSLQLSLEEYPVMDGSTANLPMMAEILSEVCAIPLEEAEELTTCSKTPRAWENIVNGSSDILLVYEAAEETKALLEESAWNWKLHRWARCAGIYHNENNPVKDLSHSN